MRVIDDPPCASSGLVGSLASWMRLPALEFARATVDFLLGMVEWRAKRQIRRK